MQQAALIILAAGAAAISAGAANAVPRPSTCPAGKAQPPFYGVTATHVGEGRDVQVQGNYRVKERNRRLSLIETGESSTLLRLALRSSKSSGHPPGCPHFGGSFSAALSVTRVQITDWKKNRISVRVTRPHHHA